LIHDAFRFVFQVRILFLWITAQNLETIKFSKHISVDSPLGFLKAIYDKEESYAALFLRLCRFFKCLFLKS